MAEVPDNIAPSFMIQVEGNDITGNVSDFIQSIEYESSDSIADVAKIVLSNPDFVLTQSRLFQPYNEMSIWMGWGKKLTHIGRVMLIRPKCIFPDDGMPTLEVTGYTKDWLFTQKHPDPDEEEETSKAKGEKKKIETSFGNMAISDAVEKIAKLLGFNTDVDPIDLDEIENLDWPANMSASEYLRGLSNLTGFFIWVDGDAKGKWTLHFKDPTKIISQQQKRYKFVYGGQSGTLLRFEPELSFSEKYTKIRVEALGYYGKKFGTIADTTIVISDSPKDEDPLYKGDPKEKVRQFSSAEAVKLYIGDFSFVFEAGIGMDDTQKLKTWATEWFKKMRENFMTGNGNVIGIEDLMARQEHDLEGMGPPYDGKWYFSRVRHTLNESGYFCDFSARKVI